jgi:hypothetical protein
MRQGTGRVSRQIDGSRWSNLATIAAHMWEACLPPPRIGGPQVGFHVSDGKAAIVFENALRDTDVGDPCVLARPSNVGPDAPGCHASGSVPTAA